MPGDLAVALMGNLAGDFAANFDDEAGFAFAGTALVLDLAADTAAFRCAGGAGLPLALPATDALFLLVTI